MLTNNCVYVYMEGGVLERSYRRYQNHRNSYIFTTFNAHLQIDIALSLSTTLYKWGRPIQSSLEC